MKNRGVIIADAFCGVLILISVLVYVIVGLAADWWHPGWVIIVGACIFSGIVSIIANSRAQLSDKPEEVKVPKKFNDL